jgi:hypothetical protein
MRKAKEYIPTNKDIDSGGVRFGCYQGKIIQWDVLANMDDKALLISQEVILRKKYHERNENITWENCTLRKWLNSDFLREAFGERQQSMFNEGSLKNAENQNYGTDGGNSTRDKVFLLSIDVARKYFKDDTSRIAKFQGKEAWWWLRSPGYDSLFAAGVYSDGSVLAHGNRVHLAHGGVRPAFWLNLDS